LSNNTHYSFLLVTKNYLDILSNNSYAKTGKIRKRALKAFSTSYNFLLGAWFNMKFGPYVIHITKLILSKFKSLTPHILHIALLIKWPPTQISQVFCQTIHMLGFVQIIDSHTSGPQIKMIQNTNLFISSNYMCKNFKILNLRTSRAQNNHPTISMTAKIYAQTVKKL